MWQAMIVDDEPIIRYGIKASVDWEREGVEIAADCANGAEALQLMETRRIDLLITDIKMPVLDGLALTKQALSLNPGIKVILVSSHNDFEYVREGLKLGVADYILKHTLEPEELVQVVRRCIGMLQRESGGNGGMSPSAREERAKLRKSYESDLKQHLLQRSGSLSVGAYPEWLNEEYAGLLIHPNRVYYIEEQQGYLYKSVLMEQLTEVLYGAEPEGLAVQSGEHELFYLMPVPDAADVERAAELRERLLRLRDKLEREGGAGLTIGYAEGWGAGDIRSVFFGSKEASDRGFFEGSGIYSSESASSRDREGMRLPAMYQEAEGLVDEKLQTLVAEWKEDWSQGGCPPLVLKEEASRVLSIMFKHQVDPYALVESFDRLFKTETLAELCDTLLLVAGELRKSRSDFDAPGFSHPIDKALEYIRTHYLETMTLQQVADIVHVSKNYFSILFKKVTGHNFIDYVITLRIQRAKELLAGSELKVYEVAELSGFNDVKYFSKLFKKMTGQSPVDYREQKLHKADGCCERGGGTE
ncbi:response regulator [Paenibacillus sp. NPDC057967]|uniref:response regulator transcription factor n=1 Tax=Paenibacillus sp. NPDC057967 TaxID=3346293 RepID=UPI0036D9D020